MNEKIYEQLFDALETIVEEDKPFDDKVAAIKEWMGEREEMNLEEFISWFDKE